jgi:tetratricopeptide (TPR) repeat protein
MWRLGRRSQALAEWSTAARSQTRLFREALPELANLGARPAELARLAGESPERLLELARFLLATAPPEQSEKIIDAASQAGAPALEVALLSARMKLLGTDRVATAQAVERAKSLGPGDPRVALLEAESVSRGVGTEAGVQALAVIERALDRDPNDLDLQRKRIEIVQRFERWTAADRAINGFKQALQAADRSTVEANVAAATIYLSLGRTREALAEYRIATTADPGNVGVWRQFAAVAEATKHYVLAREAYSEAMRLAPDAQTSEALRRLDDLQTSERLQTNLHAGGVDLR